MAKKDNISEIFDKGTYIGEFNEYQLKLIIKTLMQIMSCYNETIDIIFNNVDLSCDTGLTKTECYIEIIKQQLRVINKIDGYGDDMVTYEKGNMFITFQGSGSAEMSFPKVFALDALNFLNDLLEQPFNPRYMSGSGGGTKRIQTTSAYGYSKYNGKIKEFYGNWWYSNDLKEVIRILECNVVTLKNLMKEYKTKEELIKVLKDKSISELNHLLEEAKR